MLSAGLGGCETGASLFGSSAPKTAEIAASPAPALEPQIVARFALAPIIGAPDPLAKQLVQQMRLAGEKQKLAFLDDRDAKADYTLRGYIVASRDKAGTKVSYIWDVSDQSGKRVNRITGEEVVAGTPNAKDSWTPVTAAVTQTIADKTAAALGSWAPNQSPVAMASAQGSQSPAPAGAGASTIAGSATGSTAIASTATTTAALPRSDDIIAIIPTVAGAPGDGNGALADALQRELSRQGVNVGEKTAGDKGADAAYKIEGKVSMAAPKDGKQAIQIDWRVKDPQGKSLGTVSQKNEIPPGSLDASWGKTADAAAAAAAQGIIKLLPQPKSIN